MNNLLYLFSIVLFISCNGNIEKKEFNNINNPLLVGDFLFVNKNSDSFEENKLLGEDSLEILKPTYITELDLSNETKFAIKRAVFLGTQEKLSLQENFELDSLYKIYGEREDVWYIGEIGCSWYCGGGNYKVNSSSELDSTEKNNYSAEMANDLSYKTAWVEGKRGSGINEYLEYHFEFRSPRVTSVIITNGYVKTPQTWKENNRVKLLQMYINGKKYKILELDDSRTNQEFQVDTITSLNIDSSDLILKFEILEVYKGVKYDETAITEIFFDGVSSDIH